VGQEQHGTESDERDLGSATGAEEHLGQVEGAAVVWRPGAPAGPGDEIVVQEGEVHSLENTGSKLLDFAFSCPAAHLTEEDRVFTSDMKNGEPEYQSPNE
jgi:oxalate decarboxylase/phosphoglucose isomerase-like protein (cupin superfamily)